MFTNVLVFSTYATYVCDVLYDARDDLHARAAGWSLRQARINSVLDIKPHVVPGAKTEGSGTGTVEFRDVSFRYPGAAADELEHISFKVEKGQTLAIIARPAAARQRWPPSFRAFTTRRLALSL